MNKNKKIPRYSQIISLKNLFQAWREFVKGKKYKKDVIEFSFNLAENIFDLHEDLKNKTYKHGGYHAFNISDPKPRNIHKATVRDRLLHHAIYRVLYTYFDNKFIYDSYSCRKWKGTHRALKRFKELCTGSSHSYRKTVWILKCDVRKFFASIDQKILMNILEWQKLDKDTLWLANQVVGSFSSTKINTGLPLGNLTSQLLVNIYMDWFDQYIKHKYKIKYYIRYADDFVIFDADRKKLEAILAEINCFLKDNLSIALHPDKVFIKTLASGVDFLGWVHFPTHRVLRTATKRRMMRNLNTNPTEASVQSYLGMLSHGNTKKIQEVVRSYQAK